MAHKPTATVRKAGTILHRLVLQPGDTGRIQFDSGATGPATVFAANHSSAGEGRTLSLSTSVVDAAAFNAEFDPIRVPLGVNETGEVPPQKALAVALPSGVRTLHCDHSADATDIAVIEVQE